MRAAAEPTYRSFLKIMLRAPAMRVAVHTKQRKISLCCPPLATQTSDAVSPTHGSLFGSAVQGSINFSASHMLGRAASRALGHGAACSVRP